MNSFQFLVLFIFFSQSCTLIVLSSKCPHHYVISFSSFYIAVHQKYSCWGESCGESSSQVQGWWDGLPIFHLTLNIMWLSFFSLWVLKKISVWVILEVKTLSGVTYPCPCVDAFTDICDVIPLQLPGKDITRDRSLKPGARMLRSFSTRPTTLLIIP